MTSFRIADPVEDRPVGDAQRSVWDSEPELGVSVGIASLTVILPMKNLLSHVGFFLVAFALGASVQVPAAAASKATEDMRKTQEALKAGEIATSATGFFMKAQENGKEWVATAIMSTEDTGRILGMRGDEADSISLPFVRSKAVAGRTIKFGENMAVDLFVKDDVGTYGATTGAMTFTKVDDNSAEGTFFFTATSDHSPKKIAVTEGSFRILFRKRSR